MKLKLPASWFGMWRGDHHRVGDAGGRGDRRDGRGDSGRLEVIDAELGDVRKRLEKLYEAIETSELTPKRGPVAPHPVSEAP